MGERAGAMRLKETAYPHVQSLEASSLPMRESARERERGRERARARERERARERAHARARERERERVTSAPW